MTDYAADKAWKQAKQLQIMQAAYQLFSHRGIAREMCAAENVVVLMGTHAA